MGPALHWVWDHFETDGQFFRENNSNKNAWCIACLDAHRRVIREASMPIVELDSRISPLTEEEITTEARQVRKATEIGMNIKRKHAQAGRVKARAHRDFFIPESDTESHAHEILDMDNPSNIDLLEFTDLSNELIARTAEEDRIESEEVLQSSGSITIPAFSGPSGPPRASTRKISVPLQQLFIYPPASDTHTAAKGLGFFWNGGIRNLERERKAYEVLLATTGIDACTDALHASTTSNSV
ncbi:hypothetical protein H0H81_001649 [Sphagnurus paluster]|uniref:Uncharacterized protein n=1 Tax=Sphagnurus paluster TaxID=117069 RepID=A0A9P7GH15_9AGAR|nr:hypothetical protein H0H81_001649 [Sphagnurus paluster]